MNLRPIPLLLLLCPLLAAPALAETTVACHCFQQRVFDPSSPRAADAYLLAATSNALLARVFDVPRRDLVKAKMGGTPDPALWIALHLAVKSNRTSTDLLTARQKTGKWDSAFDTGGADPEQIGPRLTAALLAGAPDETLAGLVLAEILLQRLKLPADQWDPLSAAESSRQEKVASLLLSAATGRPPARILQEARAAGGSWGLLFQEAGLLPEALEATWARLLDGPGDEETRKARKME